MNHLLLNAVLLLMLSPQDKTLAAEFFQIPEQIRESATIIISGTFGQGRTSCVWRPDGTRVWFLDSSFSVKKVHRGKVHTNYIRINKAMLPKTEYVTGKLEQDHRYLVLLRPDGEKMQKIRTKEGISFWDALRDQEIIAILELK